MDGAELLEEVLDESRDVVTPLAEGRELDHDHGDPVVEIRPEAAVRHRFAQVLVAGRDQADVRPDRLASPYLDELVGLDDAEELGLQGEGQLADLAPPLP